MIKNNDNKHLTDAVIPNGEKNNGRVAYSLIFLLTKVLNVNKLNTAVR